MTAIAPFTGTQPYRVTADDYLRLIFAGGFGDAHVELVAGELIEMAPGGLEHGKLNIGVGVKLAGVYDSQSHTLFADVIVRLSDSTVRAPDIAVVDCDTDGRKHLTPEDILLAIEISDTTLAEDLGPKRIDYARAGIRHYWVVDVAGRRVHCHADPKGDHYGVVDVAGFGQPVPVPGTQAVITLG